MSTLRSCLVLSFLTAGCAVQIIEPRPALPLAITAPAPLTAQEGHSSAENHEEHHGAGAQTVNFFLGGSDEVGDLGGITYGMDYEYRLSSHWGVGGFVEVVTGADRSFAGGLQASWHAYRELVLVGGVAAERHHDEWGGVLRVGAVYEWSLGDGWLLSPGVFYDFSEHTDLLIYGISLGHTW